MVRPREQNAPDTLARRVLLIILYLRESGPEADQGPGGVTILATLLGPCGTSRTIKGC